MGSTNGRRSYGLKAEEDVSEGMTRIAAGRAETALERLNAVRAGEADSAEGIHGARKDLKKLRTVLRLLRGSLPKSLYRKENRRYRDAGRALSASRDAEVKLQTILALCEREEGLPADPVASWRRILERDRDAATDTLAGDRAIAEAVELIEGGLGEIGSWGVRGDSWDVIEEGVRRTYRDGRRAMRSAAANPHAGEFHQWRKRSKDLWYETRLLSEAWPGPLEALAEEAHRLAELLGDHHDLAVLREDLGERRLGEGETAVLADAIDAAQEELAASAFGLGHRLYAEPPKRYRRRTRRYWKAWRG